MNLENVTLTENRVQHLCKAANTLTTSQISNILKSYYLTKCRTLTLSGSVTLPQRFSKSTLRCPKCCVQYEDGPVTYKVQPGRKSKFARNLLKKNQKGKSLTRYQNTYLKDLMRNDDVDAHNMLVITCGVCKHATTEKLKKPQTLDTNTTPELSSIRKKKKKKDRFSGLNKNAVLSATPQGGSIDTSKFVPLEVTPLRGIDVKKDVNQTKNLFKPQNINNQGNIIAKKSKNKKGKLKKHEGLSNILNESQSSKKPSTALKLFLTSI